MSTKQEERAEELFRRAKLALEALAEERLNLDSDARDALNEARDKLGWFEHYRRLQPIDDVAVEGRAL